ncbi:hypothetical protein [Paracoccus sp. SMMA_5]|nr:hypothetical protein [Paracoccus sp. SMMA_5]UXU75126.1 hypothetical protein GB879_001095 [Paracoccus sp. SMMA_5]
MTAFIDLHSTWLPVSGRVYRKGAAGAKADFSLPLSCPINILDRDA